MKNEVTTVTHTNLLSPQVWGVMRDQASILVRSGFLPASIKTPEQAIAIMMKGYEIGIPPMQAFSQINVIQGKPTASAELMLGLIYKNCPGAKINFIQLENDSCHIEASRPGSKKTLFKFDKEDALQAGLLTKDNWKKWPRAMFRSRCVSEMARTVFPDSIMGLSYTAEEINPDIEINEEGEILDILKPNIPPSIASIELYDQDNTKHIVRLESILREMKVPETDWGIVSENLHGKEMTPKTVKEICKKVFEGNEGKEE